MYSHVLRITAYYCLGQDKQCRKLAIRAIYESKGHVFEPEMA